MQLKALGKKLVARGLFFLLNNYLNIGIFNSGL